MDDRLPATAICLFQRDERPASAVHGHGAVGEDHGLAEEARDVTTGHLADLGIKSRVSRSCSPTSRPIRRLP